MRGRRCAASNGRSCLLRPDFAGGRKPWHSASPKPGHRSLRSCSVFRADEVLGTSRAWAGRGCRVNLKMAPPTPAMDLEHFHQRLRNSTWSIVPFVEGGSGGRLGPTVQRRTDRASRDLRSARLSGQKITKRAHWNTRPRETLGRGRRWETTPQ